MRCEHRLQGCQFRQDRYQRNLLSDNVCTIYSILDNIMHCLNYDTFDLNNFLSIYKLLLLPKHFLNLSNDASLSIQLLVKEWRR